MCLQCIPWFLHQWLLLIISKLGHCWYNSAIIILQSYAKKPCIKQGQMPQGPYLQDTHIFIAAWLTFRLNSVQTIKTMLLFTAMSLNKWHGQRSKIIIAKIICEWVTSDCSAGKHTGNMLSGVACSEQFHSVMNIDLLNLHMNVPINLHIFKNSNLVDDQSH